MTQVTSILLPNGERIELRDWEQLPPKWATLHRCTRSTGVNGRGRRKACRNYMGIDGPPGTPLPPADERVCGKHRRRLKRRHARRGDTTPSSAVG